MIKDDLDVEDVFYSRWTNSRSVAPSYSLPLTSLLLHILRCSLPEVGCRTPCGLLLRVHAPLPSSAHSETGKLNVYGLGCRV